MFFTEIYKKQVKMSSRLIEAFSLRLFYDIY